jgi:hypothetical protein
LQFDREVLGSALERRAGDKWLLYDKRALSNDLMAVLGEEMVREGQRLSD